MRHKELWVETNAEKKPEGILGSTHARPTSTCASLRVWENRLQYGAHNGKQKRQSDRKQVAAAKFKGEFNSQAATRRSVGKKTNPVQMQREDHMCLSGR